MGQNHLFGAMEGGGTKFVCAVGTGPDDLREEVRFPTTVPAETLAKAVEFFKKWKPAAISVASFGPVDLHPESLAYGHITATPKPGWSHTDVLGAFKQAFNCPLVFETDVDAASFGEYTWIEANRRLESLVYFTIGTGIGAGLVLNGQLVHGLTHPEAGHMRLPHDFKRDPFAGGCPFHGDCFEGLANGPALALRWGQPAETLPESHPAWELEAHYIALAMVNVICTLSPQRIILGGGVMQQPFLFPLIRRKVREALNGYIASPVLSGDLQSYIVPPGLGKRSGILGALALARREVNKEW